MRLRSLLMGDVRFQFKYGFYFLYLLFSLLYVALLSAFPEEWRIAAAALMILTDPAAMGLYFMGAILFYEKSERVLDSLAVSPVRPLEYVLSKLFSIGLISTIAGLTIGAAGGVGGQPLCFSVGLLLCSCLFSAIGLLLACKTSTLNQFILATVPAELAAFFPALFWLFGNRTPLYLLHPGVCMVALATGEDHPAAALLSLLFWTALFTYLACNATARTLNPKGGIRA